MRHPSSRPDSSSSRQVSGTHRWFGWRQQSQQRGHQRRLALVEALRMKRLLEHEQLVVEMVTKLVNQRAQKGLERDDVLLLRGAHPYADAGERSLVFRFVEAVQFAGAVRGSRRLHPYPHRGDAIAGRQRID